MKKFNLPLLLLIITVSTLMGCAKDEVIDPLFNKTWKRALKDQNPSTNPQGEVLYQPISDCQKDDVFSFNADGTFKIDNGTEKCEPTEAKTETGTYSVANKEIIIKGTKYTLAEASATQVKYYTAVASGSGFVYVIVLLQ